MRRPRRQLAVAAAAGLRYVGSIEPLDSGDARIHMQAGDTVPCSRSYREALRSRIASGSGAGQGARG